ncbi:MAG: EAL domain-containing protein [Gammaproteobacteria bacterium]
MDKKLDIIPILVIADSANKAEMLNGQLRSQGLAVKPSWTTELEDGKYLDNELVFYFADTEKPTLDKAIEHATNTGASLIVIGREKDSKTAASALAAGAADWVNAGDDALLAAVAGRERARHNTLQRIRMLERDNERNRELLRKQMSGSQDAIATLQDGIIVEANVACAQCFGYESPEVLVGLPLMDLFASASQSKLKKALKAVLKKGTSFEAKNLTLHKADGKEREVNASFDSVERGGTPHILIRIRGDGARNEAMEHLEAIEAKNEKLEKEAEALLQYEAATRLLRPGIFAPAASERLGSTQTGMVRALVSIHPVDLQKALATFGPIGTAELGDNLAIAASPLLEEDDLATRIGNLNILAIVARPDESSVKRWAGAAVKTLGEKVLEGGGHSSHLDFVAGYAPVERTRRLDDLIRQALEAAAKSAPGTVSRSAEAAEQTLEIGDESWEALIREALEEHRYTIALSPIENLATGEHAWEALPRLLDRDGNEIGAEAFQPPAKRLGLLPALEHRLAGHAIRALMEMSGNTGRSRVIVPLNPATMADTRFYEFLDDLLKRTGKPLPPKSLILELEIEEVSSRVHEAERFAERATAAGCCMGLRGYIPKAAEGKLLKRLPIESLRTAPGFVELLMSEDADNPLKDQIRNTVEGLQERGTLLIATNVSDPNMMARLYNLGIEMVQGPVIGKPELFRSPKE